MAEVTNFKVCSDYRRDDFDFSEIQMNPKNPVVKGKLYYPFLMPSHQGSSFTYKLSPSLFFKRKLQDGGNPLHILSQHHHNLAYNELQGSLDDLGEVIAYFLSLNMIDPKTGKPIIEVPEYRLATFTDKEGILYRGCVSQNICKDDSERLVTMNDILKFTGKKGNSIDEYMDAIRAYCKSGNVSCDYETMRRGQILKSAFSWFSSDSDDHKLNVTCIVKKRPDGKFEIVPGGKIDNGSVFELSAPYLTGGDASGELHYAQFLNDDTYSSVNQNGERVFDFRHYPRKHTAFHLNAKLLLMSDTKWGDVNYLYEYCLASEMLSDKELFRQCHEMYRQLDIEKAIEAVDETYGASIKGAPKTATWPPLLKDYMRETHRFKKRTLSFVVADYYLDTAFNALIEKSDRKKPSKLYQIFQERMLGLPLQVSKEAYDERFLNIANLLGIEVDKEKLASLEFKLQEEPAKAEQQPS